MKYAKVKAKLKTAAGDILAIVSAFLGVIPGLLKKKALHPLAVVPAGEGVGELRDIFGPPMPEGHERIGQVGRRPGPVRHPPQGRPPAEGWPEMSPNRNGNTVPRIIAGLVTALILSLAGMVMSNSTRITTVETEIKHIADQLSSNAAMVERNRTENRDEHIAIGKKLDEIKDKLNGKSK